MPSPDDKGRLVPTRWFVPNRCVGITAGGFDFDLFANSSCGSFAAPPTPDQLASPDFTPSPEQLAALASDRALSLAPRPRLASSPRGVGLTGLRTFVWLGEPLPTVEASASIPGLVVTAEARPVRYIWSFGDGSQRSTTHDGRPWTRRRPGDIGHVYETTGRYDLAVDVIWAARWRINDAGWRELGYFSTSAARSYPVREMRPMLVRSRR